MYIYPSSWQFCKFLKIDKIGGKFQREFERKEKRNTKNIGREDMRVLEYITRKMHTFS